MHAAFIAHELGIRLVVVPPAPGTFSGLGFLCSDFRHDFVQTFLMSTARADPAKFADIFADLEAKGLQLLTREGFHSEQTALFRSVDVRYVGQAHEVSVPIQEVLSQTSLTWIADEFHRRHNAQYGHSSADEPVELVNCRLTAVGQVIRPPIFAAPAARREPLKGQRPVYFKELGGWAPCQIYERTALPAGLRIRGPAILEEHTTTVVVPPGFEAEADRHGNLLLRLA